VILFAGKTSKNSAMESGVSEVVIAENLAMFPFLQVRIIPFLGNEMREFPQWIIALWVVRYCIPRNMSSLSKEHRRASVISRHLTPTGMTGCEL